MIERSVMPGVPDEGRPSAGAGRRAMPERRHHLRGSVYIAVLGSATLVTVLGLSALVLARMGHRQAGQRRSLARARLNALAAVEGGGTVNVSAGLTRTLVSVEVVDTGMGIAPQDQERMFEPFFTTRREGEGTGLGLSLVYETISRHDGTVTGSSAGKGHGATFRITLPRILGEA